MALPLMHTLTRNVSRDAVKAGKYGNIRQIRKGNSSKTKGTCFVVYEDIYCAKNAVDHLNGFNVAGKYLI